VTLPLGLLVVLATEGLSAGRRAAGLAVSVPIQATRAYLTGVHALDPELAQRATRRANRETGLVSLAVLVSAGVLLVLALR